MLVSPIVGLLAPLEDSGEFAVFAGSTTFAPNIVFATCAHPSFTSSVENYPDEMGMGIILHGWPSLPIFGTFLTDPI